MFERVDEPVEVLVGFKQQSHSGKGSSKSSTRVLPYLLSWRGSRYKLDIMGLHHPARKGINRIHFFEFTSGNTKFKLELDSETLEWRLVEVYYEHSR